LKRITRIFTIVNQIHDELTGETDNHAINLFIEHLQDKYNFGTNPEFGRYGTPIDLEEFSEITRFISCVYGSFL
jgi:hypothetical protein